VTLRSLCAGLRWSGVAATFLAIAAIVAAHAAGDDAAAEIAGIVSFFALVTALVADSAEGRFPPPSNGQG